MASFYQTNTILFSIDRINLGYPFSKTMHFGWSC